MTRADAAGTEERVAKLRALIDRDPDDATTWFGLGRALIDLSRWREAIDAFGHALARNPRYTAAHRDLGRALLEAGEVAEAARVLRSALELARESGDLQTGREMETFLGRAEKILGVPATARTSQKPAPAEKETVMTNIIDWENSGAGDGPQRSRARLAVATGEECHEEEIGDCRRCAACRRSDAPQP